MLAEFRQALQQDNSGIRLLVPTPTMAEHLRHKLAREGFVLRPSLILTLSKFVAPWAEDLPEISAAVLYLLVERVAATSAGCTSAISAAAKASAAKRITPIILI